MFYTNIFQRLKSNKLHSILRVYNDLLLTTDN